MPHHQHPAAGILFVLFLIWMLFPEADNQTQSLALSDLAAERLTQYSNALHVLNTTNWGDFAPPEATDSDPDTTPRYLNLTGFREEDGFAWEDLARFRERGLRLSRHAVPAIAGRQLWDVAQGEVVWANASGTLHGEWVRRPGSVPRGFDSYNLSRSVPSMDWVGDRVEWARNMTGETGRMMLRLEGNKTVTTYDDLAHGSVPLSGGVIRNVKGTATIEDTTGSGLNWEMRLWGVHWPRQGVVVMATTSEKFEGIFGLPHLTPGGDFFRSSQMLLNQTLNRVVTKKHANVNLDQNMPWNSDIDNPLYTATPSPHCEFVMYAQTDPVEDVIRAIESELQNPEGAPIRSVPRLKMSAVIYSPDCAFFLETKGPPDFPLGEADHLVGMKTEVHTHQVKTWMLIYALVVLAQVRLLKNQMQESFTPSTMGRVSFWTISAMAIVDGMTFTAAATWVSSAAATFLPTLALMFASFLSMTIGGSFLAKIHEVQLPESRGRRDPGTGSGRDASPPSSSSTPGLVTPGPLTPGPLTPPLTASRSNSQPVIVPSDQDIDAEIASNAASGASAVPRPPVSSSSSSSNNNPPAPRQSPTFQAMVGRFILFSLCVSFLAISSSTWYPRARSAFLNLCTFAYLSLWLPQIYRNTARNCRRALRWQFVVGQSVLRLLPVAYFWAKDDNFLYARTDRPAFVVLCAWVWVQVLVLAAQEVVGPRFGVPPGWTPDAWDYHPVLREDTVEAGGLPIGLVAAADDDGAGSRLASRRTSHASAASGEKRGSVGSGVGIGGASGASGSVRAIDCAICREVLEVPVLTARDEDASVASVFARRLYMVTPCRHIFHTTCLEGWMRFRLQCPICREELPPI
ncbi:RING-H2 zinc finger domain-containing protein [Hirsutella rhossiliensis]|uniref:DSC E3 ubiquitin ligase complex subunit A n=1 Tax=Hirsutella rhossiliensis TaxID=111463 RepID=A0A9P8N1B1_9HYPO|nr:RING-H2 zinc finger domain-containing protein [Hirsutella rhossiliensis]KAH0965040.1 RING-H2 zinc finger domain-containing protein [Hirsutella rhossiliensis]